MFPCDTAQSEIGRGVRAHAHAETAARVRFPSAPVPSDEGTAPVRGRLRMVRRAFARFMRPLECPLCRTRAARARHAWN
jgi:hypothetical protein